jgi:hypothetical protein
MTTTPKHPVGLIGYGRFGSVIASTLNSLGHPVHVYDDDPDAARRARAEHDILTGTTRGDLAHLSHIVIATPPTTPGRVDLAANLIQHGTHVRLEKPAALTKPELDQLNRAWYTDKTPPGILTVSHTPLHHPAYQLLKHELEEAPRLELTRIGPEPRHNVSAWLDVGVHALTILADLDRLTHPATPRNTSSIVYAPTDETTEVAYTPCGDTIVLNTDPYRTPVRSIKAYKPTSRTPYLTLDELTGSIHTNGTSWGTMPIGVRLEPLRLELEEWLNPGEPEYTHTSAALIANLHALNLTTHTGAIA